MPAEAGAGAGAAAPAPTVDADWPWPILLDVSRLLSRLGQGPLTGIDRVEAEWLAHLIAVAPGRLWLLCRSGGRQLLLPGSAGSQILRWAAGDLRGLDPVPVPVPVLGPVLGPLLARLRRRGPLRDDPRRRADSLLRQQAIAWGGRDGQGLVRFLRRHLRGGVYLNLGHANLRDRLWRRLGRVPGLLRVVLIHDTIPLDYPQFTRPDQRRNFQNRFVTAMRRADLVLTVSGHSRDCVLAARRRLDLPQSAPVHAAPIGIRLCPPAPQDLPAGLDLSRPYFVALGTIEPRKNHALLLDIWEGLSRRLPADRMPRLFIVGRRGWMNRDVFARLDALPADSAVQELSGLGDGAVAALLEGCHALLMPSHAEGFGLPMAEAAACGIPVLAAPLPSGREILGDHALYLSADLSCIWEDEVINCAAKGMKRLQIIPLPQWSDHFATARRHIARQR